MSTHTSSADEREVEAQLHRALWQLAQRDRTKASESLDSARSLLDDLMGKTTTTAHTAQKRTARKASTRVRSK